MTEIHNAAHMLMAPATLAPPPCIELGATRQPPRTLRRRPCGALDAYSDTTIEGCATTRAEHLPGVRSVGHVEPIGRHKGSISAYAQAPAGAVGRDAAPTTHHRGCVRPAGTFPVSA